MKRFPLAILAMCLIGLSVMSGLKVGDPPGVQMHQHAKAFLSTLDKEQSSQAVIPFDDERRVQWHFIPMKTRKGLMLGDMTEAQRTGALRLLRAALSEIGYRKADQIRSMEQVLHVLEGDGGNWKRDPMKYYVTVFGQPDDQKPWGLSFEGHHLSLNFVCRGGRIVDSTPQFMASNPATLMNEVDDPSVTLHKGTRILRDEEQLGFDLVNSLSDAQRSEAIIAEEALSEIRFAGEAQADVTAPEGIRYQKLDADQQQILQRLVDTYIDVVPDPVAVTRRDAIAENGWNQIHFAWAGATEPGIGHYYRVQGKSFLIEFVNTQSDAVGNPANHIHCVWRDLTGDFDLPASQ
ncbi:MULTISPECIES: DUF3500 domain-containing protein [Crateriforma]|nr:MULTISPECIES: DUF3500 domain-containing protein [Crateriforma]